MHGLVAPRDGVVGFVAPPRAGLEVSEGLERLKGISGSFGLIKKEKFGLPELAAPRAGLESFGQFEAFEGSIRKFRIIKKGKIWFAIAGSSKSRFRRFWRV